MCTVRASRITLHKVEKLIANHTPKPQPPPLPQASCLMLPTPEVLQAIITANPYITLPQLQAMFQIPTPAAPAAPPSAPAPAMARSPETTLYVLQLDRGISYETALQTLQTAQQQGTSTLSSFYESKNPMFGNVCFTTH